MNNSARYSPTLLLAVAATVALIDESKAQTVMIDEVILFDDFSTTDTSGDPTLVDTTVWRLPFDSEGTFVGRTRFRGDSSTDVPLQGIAEPLASDGLVTEIHLDTFSSVEPGAAFLGTDLLTKRDFARGGGLSFEGRLRLKPGATAGGVYDANASLGGTINGFFSFDVSREVSLGSPPENRQVRDEIDFELLGNQTGPAGAQDIFTNVFDDVDFDGILPDNPALTNVNGLDLTQFQDYRVEWTPQAVKWFVNDSLVRAVTENVPQDPQKLHFNLWAPDSGFADAFNAALQPTAVEAENTRYTAQLDHVEVRRLNTEISDNLLTDPSMEGAQPTLNVAAGTTTGQWFSFNNAQFVVDDILGTDPNLPDMAADGISFGQVFGPFAASATQTDASGFIQQVAAAPGEEFEVSAKVLTPSGADTIAGSENFTTVAISFVNEFGAELLTAPFVPQDGSDFPLLDGRDPNIVEDVYVEGTASAVAPAGTAFARVTLLFVQIIDGTPGPGGIDGAAYFDDVSLVKLTALAPPIVPGDFNGDTVVDAADYTVWRDNLGASDESLIGDAGDGLNGVDAADYLVWRNAFLGLPGASTLISVPEPSAALLMVGSTALLFRRRR
ncbi:MAG: glycoside hydrolase family 16 protein [Planctomycetota bacterium]